MVSNPIQRLTEEQYLALEESSEERHEFLNGEMFAMSGGTSVHARVQGNLFVELFTRLEGKGCEVYTADLRIRVSKTRLYTYPDVSVVCGEQKFADAKKTTLLNPSAVLEVLSPSTESYDRGKKFQHYREIESLRDYILVSQDQIRVEHYVRQGDGTWSLRDYLKPGDELRIDSIDVSIPLASIYRRVEFQPPVEAEHPGGPPQPE